MRTTFLMLIAALALGSGAALAQTPQPAGAQPSVTPFTGTLDVGPLLTGTDGDAARYERYRDTRNGVYSSFTANRLASSYLFDASAFHIGYRDQRYNANYTGSRVRFNFNWTSIPLNFSYITRTPYTITGSTLSLPDSAQAAVQGPTIAPTDGAVGVPCAPGGPPAACNNSAQVAQALANRSIYNGLANTFDLQYKRDIASVNLTYAATKALDIDGAFTTNRRKGEQPWGASFAFNNAVELPQPIDQRTNDATLGASWANRKAMFRVSWNGSFFNNQYQSLTWDNPLYLTDYNNGVNVYNCPASGPSGPWDCSGYVNGNGPAQGRMALAPDNTMNVFSGTGLYRLPHKTTINGTIQYTDQRQDEALIPWTSNQLIASAPTYVNFPHLATLPRASADASAVGINTLVNLTSRLSRRVNATVRYRYNRRDVRTPVFDATEYVRFDAVPEENPEGFSPQFDNSHQFLDANLAFTPAGWGTIRVGYGYEGISREGRGFANTGEHTARVSYDIYSNQYVTVRASADAGRRRGSGYVEAASGNDVGPGGTQPTLRYYDEADRNRTRGSLVFTVTPRDTVDLFFQVAGTKDEYLADDSVPVSRPGELFGLHSQSIYNWNLGLNFHPSQIVTFGASYGHDAFASFQVSRNANPPPDPTWTDPTRNWNLDNHDHIKNVNVFVDVLRAIRNTDIRFAYDFNDSDNSFVHSGPRIDQLAAIGQFIPLPDVTNAWHRLTADVQYFLNARAGIGVGYSFEKLAVLDWNTIDINGPVGFTAATGDPRIDYLGGLITGYGNRPYTGNTVYVRALYRF
jgi:Putative outer membrane beta-barrel porin, MtrB/PioB